MNKTKRCYKCNEIKPLSRFHRDKTTKDGHTAKCKVCVKAYHGERYEVNREEVLEYYRNQYLWNKHGLVLSDYDEMLEVQGGGCAVCGRTPEENGKRLCVDHNHETDEIRGLLCPECNFGLGMFQDSPELLRSAIQYLQYVQLRKESVQ